MYCINLPNTLNIRTFQPKICSSYIEDTRKRVTCVTNASTETVPFIGDFLTDKVTEKSTSTSISSSDSPIFYESTSSDHGINYSNKTSEPRQVIGTPNSLLETTKSDDLNSLISNSSDYLLSLKSSQKPFQKITNTTTSETFGFLFALDKLKKNNNESREVEIEEIIPMTQSQEFLPTYYSNVLLSVNNRPLKKVNFDFQKQKIDRPLLVKTNENLMRPVINRQVISVVYPSMIPFNNHLNCSNVIKTEVSKLVSVASDKLLSNAFESKRDMFLPMNAEGDTYDSYSDLIKIYPSNEKSKSPDKQPLYFAYPKDITPTPTYMTSEMSKNRYFISSESIKPQKIFSQIHRNLKDVKRISRKSYKEFKDHSIETMKFFHKSLALGEY